MYHSPVIFEYLTLMFHLEYDGVSNVSKINCLITSGGIQVLPNLTPISLALISFGITCFSESAFISKLESVSASVFAILYFSLTLPLKYSSAV